MSERKLCEKCGKLIIGRRSDARKCLECRRYDERLASQKIKEIEKRERALRKARDTGASSVIEYAKSQEILKDLSEDPNKDPDVKFDNSFGTIKIKQEIKDLELKPFRELIDEKIKEEKNREEIKSKTEKKDKKQFNTFS